VDHQIDLFDAPLHFKLFTASQQGRDFDLRTLLDDTLVRKYPTLAVTFVDNHDSQRGSSLESQVKSWFKPLAYGLILLMKEGYPCIFYGDYYSMKGEASPHRAVLDILLDARRSRAFGEQTDYFDHPNTVGFTRAGDEKHPDSGLALLLSNGEDGEKVMSVGVTHANETWHEITGSYDDEIVIGDDGKALFRVHGGKLAVWVKK
jgi:alpha-amylase